VHWLPDPHHPTCSVDIDDWQTKPHPVADQAAGAGLGINGFGTPTAIYLLYSSSWFSAFSAACS